MEEERKEAENHDDVENALQTTSNIRPIEDVQKLFDRQPMIIEAIIAAEGGRTKF